MSRGKGGGGGGGGGYVADESVVGGGGGGGGRSSVAGIAYCADRSVAAALPSRCLLISLS